MKIRSKLLVAAALLAFCNAAEAAEAIGVVNFKECVENSKLGKQEQNSFDALKKQAEQMLMQKEKEFNEITAKLNDPDYLDSLSPQAEAELKHKQRQYGQELGQQQQQLYQTLSQANFKIVQKLTEEVAKAADKVASEKNLNMVVNEDACFFYAQKLDITTDVIRKMDEITN